MSYQQPQEMQYSQHQQYAPQYMSSPQPGMQQHQYPSPSPSPNPYAQPPRQNPPPPMRLIDKTIYNAQTNQPLYSYTLSQHPDSSIPGSLLSLQHVPTGTLVGTAHRGDPGGPDSCFGQCNCCFTCGCCSPDPVEDVISVGVQGAKATISDVGTGRSAWGWKTTWSGGAEEWAFVKGGGAEDLQFVKEGHLVLKDAVCNGAEVLRLHDSGDIVFTDKAMGLSEPMVGEIMLVLASISIEREDSKWAWVWELLTW